MVRQKVTTLFAKPKNRLSQTGKRFIDKLRRALGSSTIRVFGRRGSKQRRLVNMTLLALIPAGCIAYAFYNPEARKLLALLSSQAKSSLSSLISETLESSSGTDAPNSNSRSQYIYFIIGVLCIVANSILWQYDENGQIRFRFRQRIPEPEDTSYLLAIAEKIYDYLPEPISQLLILVAEIGGIFIGGSVFFADLAYGGPISYILEIIVNLFN